MDPNSFGEYVVYLLVAFLVGFIMHDQNIQQLRDERDPTWWAWLLGALWPLFVAMYVIVVMARMLDRS